MIKYRLSFILTIIWLIFIFNIERLDQMVLGLDRFDLHPSFYISALLMIVTMAAFPSLSDIKLSYSVAATVVIYTIIGMLFWQIDWPHTSRLMLILEYGFMIVTMLLMRQVSEALHEFEFAAETFVLGQRLTLLNMETGKEQIDQQLYLARRFNRPMSLIYCEFKTPMTDDKPVVIGTDNIELKITEAFKRRFTKYQLLQLINTLTYKGDLVINYYDGLVVCLPETSEEEAHSWMVKLNRLVKEKYGDQLMVGFATFPTDGLVFEDLAKESFERRILADSIIAEGLEESSEEISTPGGVWIKPETRMEIEAKDMWFSGIRNQSYTSRQLYMHVKRVIDITLVLIAMPIVLPVGLIVALLIVIEDGGTPFYMQPRTGYRGHRFKMYKFRSMRVNAQAIPATQIVLSDGTIRHIWPEKAAHDPRITRVGRILRKTSLDELPQLINVLTGDMSIVGPRPSSWDLDKYTLHQTERLTVRPGITGLWQVCARDSQNMDERLLWDMKYIDKLSPWLDIQIIIRTVLAVFMKKGI